MIRAVVCACVLASACSARTTYTCMSSDQCIENGTQGVCQAQHFCSFPDSQCPSGQRFEANAGEGLGGQCATSVPVDAAVDAPVATRDAALGPIAFVQQNAAVLMNVATQAIELTAPVGAHHAIIACADYFGDGDATVTDSLANTYHAVVGPFTAFGLKSYIFVAFDSPAGMDTITYTLSATPSEFEVYVHEYAGIAAFDVGAAASGSDATTDGMKSGTADTHAANELVFGYGVSLSGGASAGTGFTARSTFHSNVTEDEIVTTAGPYSATATMTSGMYWSMMMAIFR